MYLSQIKRLSSLLLSDEDDVVQKGLGWLLRGPLSTMQQKQFPTYSRFAPEPRVCSGALRAKPYLPERQKDAGSVSRLSAFGLFAVTAMLVRDAYEDRSHWFGLAFAAACVLASSYGFLQGAWPFGLVEAIWALVALRRWWQTSRAS